MSTSASSKLLTKVLRRSSGVKKFTPARFPGLLAGYRSPGALVYDHCGDGQNILLGYILVLISAISLGITNFVFPRASQSLGPVNATFFYYVFALLLALGYWIPLQEQPPTKLGDWQWPIYLALAMFISNLTYSYATRYLDTSLPATIRSLSFFITGLLAVYFNKEALTPKDWFALLLVAAGILLFGHGRAQ